jgi:ParB family transcriptional regulator, chromosome partitioning protein
MALANKKQALGRGLSALLKDPDNDIKTVEDKHAKEVIGNIIELSLDVIEVNPFQPRSNFNEETLRELASSIKELGVIQPITVRKVDFNKFQLISGERRLRASKIAGLETIPAYIRLANDQESLVMALVENIQRHDLDPIEVAMSYQRLIEEIQLTQEQMSERVGKKRSTISNYLRLLKLNPIIQTGMRDGFISMGHGRAIINIENDDDQLAIYHQILQQKLSVRQTEELVKKYQDGDNNSEKGTIIKAEQIKNPEFEKVLFSQFGKKYSLKQEANGKSKVVLNFSSQEELENFLNKLA